MTAPATTPTSSCPSWCVSRHDDDYDVNYRQHLTKPLVGPGGLYVEVSQNEPLNGRAAYLAKGPRLYFGVQPVEGVSLSLRQANGLAFTLSRLGQDGAARLLGEAIKLVTGEVLEFDASLAAQERATVIEYGVKAYSKYHNAHHVDACDDYEAALSTLRMTRKRIDAGALLVSRQVPAPGPVGEWRAVSPDDAAVALETARAVAR